MINLDEKLDDAINRASLEEVKTLINNGANLEYRDPFGCTPLMNAAWVASSDIINFLIEIGANINAKNNEGQTALEMIRSIGHNDYGHDEIIAIFTTISSRGQPAIPLPVVN